VRLLALTALALSLLAQDERFRTDALLVVAHPDDETVIGPYLARLIAEGRKISVVYGTRGDAGGNEQGMEQAASLGLVREIEVRKALAVSWNIHNVWILGAPDTPGQDVLRSLETWNHGQRLAEVVRIIRLTRPNVILTWLPATVVGENHGDHQAAGVIATEAFDLAGDPAAFAEQLAAPRERRNISNLTEGLQPWQAKKLYFFSDASHLEFQDGRGPVYPVTAEQAKSAAQEAAFHLTQEGKSAQRALEKGDLHEFQQPVRLVLGKSLVKAGLTGDVFEGTDLEPADATRRGVLVELDPPDLSLQLGGPWEFYPHFYATHGLDLRVPASEAGVAPGATLSVPLVLRNRREEPAEVELVAKLPAEWGQGETRKFTPPAGSPYPLWLKLKAPTARGDWLLKWELHSGGKLLGAQELHVFVVPGMLAQ
jgi:LmbE family N-acetylglucosaminyl deacetylase